MMRYWERMIKFFDENEEHYKMSDRLRKDMLYNHEPHNYELSSRVLARRYLLHLIRLKWEIIYRHDMNFDYGIGAMGTYFHEKGLQLGYDAINELEDKIFPKINEEIEKCRVALDYTTDDISIMDEMHS